MDAVRGHGSLRALIECMEPRLAPFAAGDRVQLLKRAAALLPAVARGGVELRLDRPGGAVDLQQCLRPVTDLATLQRWVAAASSPLSRDPRIVHMLRLWENPTHSCHRATEIWMECDADRPGGAPSLFVGLDREAQASLPAAERIEVLTTLIQKPLPSEVVDAFEEAGASLTFVGAMEGHRRGLRLNFRTRNVDALSRLGRLVSSAEIEAATRLYGELAAIDCRITACVQLGDVGNSIDFEVLPQNGRDAVGSWESLLRWMQVETRADETLLSQLRRWPGRVTPVDAGSTWPPWLIARSLAHDAQQLQALDAQISHLKVRVEPSGATRPKAYLWFTDATYRATRSD